MDCGFTTIKGQFRLRACAIIIEDDCVLMAKNASDDYYYSVGGAIKQNETTKAAVVREVLEETGINYQVDRLVAVHENFFTNSEGLPFHEVSFYFLMKPQGKQMPTAIGYTSSNIEEHVEWIPLNDYKNYNAYPKFFCDLLLNLPQYPQHIVDVE